MYSIDSPQPFTDAYRQSLAHDNVVFEQETFQTLCTAVKDLLTVEDISNAQNNPGLASLRNWSVYPVLLISEFAVEVTRLVEEKLLEKYPQYKSPENAIEILNLMEFSQVLLNIEQESINMLESSRMHSKYGIQTPYIDTLRQRCVQIIDWYDSVKEDPFDLDGKEPSPASKSAESIIEILSLNSRIEILKEASQYLWRNRDVDFFVDDRFSEPFFPVFVPEVNFNLSIRNKIVSKRPSAEEIEKFLEENPPVVRTGFDAIELVTNLSHALIDIVQDKEELRNSCDGLLGNDTLGEYTWRDAPFAVSNSMWQSLCTLAFDISECVEHPLYPLTTASFYLSAFHNDLTEAYDAMYSTPLPNDVTRAVRLNALNMSLTIVRAKIAIDALDSVNAGADRIDSSLPWFQKPWIYNELPPESKKLYLAEIRNSCVLAIDLMSGFCRIDAKNVAGRDYSRRGLAMPINDEIVSSFSGAIRNAIRYQTKFSECSQELLELLSNSNDSHPDACSLVPRLANDLYFPLSRVWDSDKFERSDSEV